MGVDPINATDCNNCIVYILLLFDLIIIDCFSM